MFSCLNYTGSHPLINQSSILSALGENTKRHWERRCYRGHLQVQVSARWQDALQDSSPVFPDPFKPSIQTHADRESCLCKYFYIFVVSIV